MARRVGGLARGWVGVANRRPLELEMILIESSTFVPDHLIITPCCCRSGVRGAVGALTRPLCRPTSLSGSASLGWRLSHHLDAMLLQLCP